MTFTRLLGFLRPYRWSLAISIVLAVGSQASSIGLVLVTGSVIDRAIVPELRAAGRPCDVRQDLLAQRVLPLDEVKADVVPVPLLERGREVVRDGRAAR